jgi:hypothetical protein
MALVHLGASRARERLPSKANLPGKSLSLPAQVGQVGVTTQYLPLRVRKVFRGLWVPLPAHLSYRTNQLGLRRAEKNNALDVSVDEMVVVVLLEDPCSRVAEDAISLLVRECT